MIELQHYSERKKLGFQVYNAGESIVISTIDSAECISIPYDLVEWLIGELNDYKDDLKLNGSM